MLWVSALTGQARIGVGVGAMSAVIGFATGGLISSFYGETPFGARLISAIPGLIACIGGLFSVAYVQVSRATVDTAEMTREILILSRNGKNIAPEEYKNDAGTPHSTKTDKSNIKNRELYTVGNNLKLELEKQRIKIRHDEYDDYVTYRGNKVVITGNLLVYKENKFRSYGELMDFIEKT